MRISHHYNTNSMVCVPEKNNETSSHQDTKKRHRENLFFETLDTFILLLYSNFHFSNRKFLAWKLIFLHHVVHSKMQFHFGSWHDDGCFQKVKSNTKREWNDTPENEIVWVLLIRSLSSCNFSASTSSSSSNAEASSKG